MPGMRSTPFSLLRESLRPGPLAQSRSFRAPGRLQSFPSQPIYRPPGQQPWPRNNAFVCLICQLRAHSRFYSTNNDKNNQEWVKKTTAKDGKEDGAVADVPSSAKPPAFNKSELPSQEEHLRSNLSKKFGELMDNLQSNIFVAGQHLNDLTGYTVIEKLKQDIRAQEELVRRTREKVRQAKEAYSSAINCRSASQREVNELLQRKHAWTPTDLERFTSLYRSDHVNERAEIETQEALSNAEREAEEATAELSKNILTRYHEEQVWSDKIRRMSTWGTWGLMGVNVLLFLVFQIAVEPWRRRRLVKGFEEKVAEALEKENSRHTKEISAAIEQEKPTSEPEKDSGVVASDTSDLPEGTGKPESAPEMPAEGMPTQHTSVEAESTIPELPPLTPMLPPDLDLAPEAWGKTSQAFFTERRVTILQRDLTTVVLESAAVGAAVMGGILFAISRLS
ncbi:Sensitive to high expression protein 9, mitochondrial [Trichophyton interdigitale]|uniref:Sensitive to high expression protein 9, mitochondrial n=1 Tax=Trichophyton interdigitale TaxID=101480 RepID=A0A9P4YJV4_9EURO|nr:Sensitive to high expression protein 9, mitochondrial [Trichophyton interdigitale]KAF3897120.1 Sensitive to high expression protein 9, mitochondrial [Trichophyton interdigitale]